MRIALGHLPCQLVALTAVVAVSTARDAVAAPPTPAQIEFFETSVRPLLVTHCDRCHSSSATKVKGGLRLDSLAGILKGGDTGSQPAHHRHPLRQSGFGDASKDQAAAGSDQGP